jgi:hypothetical protein
MLSRETDNQNVVGIDVTTKLAISSADSNNNLLVFLSLTQLIIAFTVLTENCLSLFSLSPLLPKRFSTLKLGPAAWS